MQLTAASARWMLTHMVGLAFLPLIGVLSSSNTVFFIPVTLFALGWLVGWPVALMFKFERHQAAARGAQDELVREFSAEHGVRVSDIHETGSLRFEVSIRSPNRIPASVRLSKQSVAPFDRETGDPTFDAAVRVRGEELEAASILNADARAAVLALLAKHPGASLKLGEFRSFAARISREEDLIALGQRLAAAVGALSSEDSPELRLARIAREDPLAAVRHRATRTLLRLRPKAPETREFALELLDGDDLQTALLAAEALGLHDKVKAIRNQVAGQRGQLTVTAHDGGELSEALLPAGASNSQLAMSDPD
jgi:hypothetical protein